PVDKQRGINGMAVIIKQLIAGGIEQLGVTRADKDAAATVEHIERMIAHRVKYPRRFVLERVVARGEIELKVEQHRRIFGGLNILIVNRAAELPIPDRKVR